MEAGTGERGVDGGVVDEDVDAAAPGDEFGGLARQRIAGSLLRDVDRPSGDVLFRMLPGDLARCVLRDIRRMRGSPHHAAIRVSYLLPVRRDS